ncbi:MAG: putative peroxidase-related enzyme [Planctomycetota bacterium]
MKDDELLAAIEADFLSADLDDRRLEMLRYALKLTETPAAMIRADVERLSAVGFSDVDVLHIAEVTAYYAYVNRIADGLGVELEQE